MKSSCWDELLELFLRENRNGKSPFVSGEAISSSLGISRTALWKRVNALRARGFVVEGERGRGYRLTASPDISAEELMCTVEGPLGKKVLFFQTVESTNDKAMGLASEGASHGTVVMAESQKRGRGRLGRKWASPGGANLYMSVILRPELPPRDAGLITLMGAVACASALRERIGLAVKIKWPNDLVFSGRKLGGILTEMRSEPDRILYAVVGIGINLNMKPSLFPGEIKETATSVLGETGRRMRRTPVAAAVLDAFSREIDGLRREGREPLMERWREMSSVLGRKVKASVGEKTIRGTAVDIDEEGCLLLRDAAGKLRRISSGDVALLRQGGG